MKKNLAIFTLLALLIATNIHRLKLFYPIAVSKLPTNISCEILIGLTKDTNPAIVQDALYRLGFIPSCNAENQILETLDHYEPNVRHNALNALNSLGKSSFALDAAIKILNDPCQEIFVHDSAIDLIKKVDIQIEKNKAITALENFIKHTEYENYKTEAERIINDLKQ